MFQFKNAFLLHYKARKLSDSAKGCWELSLTV